MIYSSDQTEVEIGILKPLSYKLKKYFPHMFITYSDCMIRDDDDRRDIRSISVRIADNIHWIAYCWVSYNFKLIVRSNKEIIKEFDLCNVNYESDIINYIESLK